MFTGARFAPPHGLSWNSTQSLAELLSKVMVLVGEHEDIRLM
jgi:hypothetical protein